MRLLDCVTKQIREFMQDAPRYAILSHTWEDEELTYALAHQNRDALRKGTSCEASRRQGWLKIRWACDQAVKDGLNYVWVDTICIDKTSSVELSEAINSMYAYYQKAVVCYVYLYDVCRQTSMLATPGYGACSSTRVVPLEKSRWFTRGWTLQELIAPRNMTFYDHHWNEMMTKKDSLSRLAEITGINEYALDGGNLRLMSIARIMSWAAKRTTTRSEDMAYSLLGLFGISMPMLYGEGDKAFVRLQTVLIQTYDDQSVFAWEFPDDNKIELDGVLAPSPRVFCNSGDIFPTLHKAALLSGGRWEIKPSAVTSRGVFFNSCIYFSPKTPGPAITVGYVVLGCVDMAHKSSMEPQRLVTIEVEFTDRSLHFCTRKRNSPLDTLDGHKIHKVYDVYAKASGSHVIWGRPTDEHHIVHICTLPKWPPGHTYKRIFPTTTRAAGNERARLNMSFADCMCIIYRRESVDDTDDDIQHRTQHIVIEVVHSASPVWPSLSWDGCCDGRHLCVGMATFEGYKAVEKWIEDRSTDLEGGFLSMSAVQLQLPGLRLNAHLTISQQDGLHRLDVFANPSPGTALISYSRAEDWDDSRSS